ncbi:MAG: hypothetical protein CSA65_08500 [Proteobacteria bacterium]|nr:MAG: hypothetical protein CSA65_08500 [Pseudomonadota bacterium]
METVELIVILLITGGIIAVQRLVAHSRGEVITADDLGTPPVFTLPPQQDLHRASGAALVYGSVVSRELLTAPLSGEATAGYLLELVPIEQSKTPLFAGVVGELTLETPGQPGAFAVVSAGAALLGRAGLVTTSKPLPLPPSAEIDRLFMARGLSLACIVGHELSFTLREHRLPASVPALWVVGTASPPQAGASYRDAAEPRRIAGDNVIPLIVSLGDPREDISQLTAQRNTALIYQLAMDTPVDDRHVPMGF